MEKPIRQQLTLFVDKRDTIEIELIRQKFNPLQRQLIDCHVTLCREDEIKNMDNLLVSLQKLHASSITIQFAQVTRFNNNLGVLMPAGGDNEQFHQLRYKILADTGIPVRRHEPHITLMHPKNSTCTAEIFKIIQSANLPGILKFETISLIEQVDGGEWQTIKKFNLI